MQYELLLYNNECFKYIFQICPLKRETIYNIEFHVNIFINYFIKLNQQYILILRKNSN